MRTITTPAGTQVELDGDVIAVVEAIRRALVRQRELDYSFEDVEHELTSLVNEMTADELRMYLKESLGITYLRYENQKLESVVKKARKAKED
jgi:type III secretory pathway component EscV